MKLARFLPQYQSDIKTVADANGIDIATAPPGKTGLLTMHALFTIARRNRAYDDTHPHFANGTWKRVLPFDGSDYNEYYADGGNDSHLETLLRKIKTNLTT